MINPTQSSVINMDLANFELNNENAATIIQIFASSYDESSDISYNTSPNFSTYFPVNFSGESPTTTTTEMNENNEHDGQSSVGAATSQNNEAKKTRKRQATQLNDTNNSNSEGSTYTNFYSKEVRRQKNGIAQKKHRAVLKQRKEKLQSYQKQLIDAGNQIASKVKKHRMDSSLGATQFQSDPNLNTQENQNRAAEYYGSRVPQVVEQLLDLYDETMKKKAQVELDIKVTLQAFDRYKQNVENSQNTIKNEFKKMQECIRQLRTENELLKLQQRVQPSISPKINDQNCIDLV